MAKGDRLRLEPRVYRDERTGREVWRLTSWNDAHCISPYMYCKGLSGDERYIIFASDRTGKFELYRLEIESGETVQLTEGRSKDPRRKVEFNVHPDGREVFYPDGKTLFAVDIETTQERLVADCAGKPWETLRDEPSFSPDGRKVVCAYDHKRGGSGVTMAYVKGSSFEDLYRFDRRLSCVQICPGDASIISFAASLDHQNIPYLPDHERARAWKLDLKTGKASPFLVVPPGFRATHEYWGPKGRRLYFHKKKVYKKKVPLGMPTSIASISVDGGDMREHFSSETRKLGHSCIDPDEKKIVTDVQDPEGNELIAIDLNTGTSKILCWPNSSLKNSLTGHVHPSFGFSGEKLLYTSDATGKAQVYMVLLW